MRSFILENGKIKNTDPLLPIGEIEHHQTTVQIVISLNLKFNESIRKFEKCGVPDVFPIFVISHLMKKSNINSLTINFSNSAPLTIKYFINNLVYLVSLSE